MKLMQMDHYAFCKSSQCTRGVDAGGHLTRDHTTMLLYVYFEIYDHEFSKNELNQINFKQLSTGRYSLATMIGTC